MLLAALFMPMTMNAQLKKHGEAPVKVAKTVKANVGVTAVKPNLTFKLNAVAPKADVPEGYAQVTLTAGDVWQDGSGYQMLLDADAAAYGAIIPETGPLTSGGDVSADIYAEFEYKIPENADGALATANIVMNNSVTITIPAGTYDWCITNPTPGDRMWIASTNGTVGGRADDANYDVCFYSESWSSNTWAALTPDNWLITPAVGMGGTLKFKTWNASASYLDQIYVYYAPASAVSGETFNTDDFIMISDGAIAPGTAPEEYEFDLSDFEGMGVIAFRHYGVSDMYSINVGYIEITVPGAQELAEWNVVENVTNPYTIEGLTPETEYEVQVQAVGPDTRTSDWTEIVNFTTLAEEDGINEFYLVGGFNNWGNDGGVPIKFEEVENGVFEAKADMTQGDEFKVITYDVDGSIIWMGGTDETGVGHYDVTTELLGVPTALYVGEGSNFMLAAESAVYKVRVTEAATTGLKGLTAPLQIEVVYYAPTAIENLNTDSKVDNTYYNLQGVKFNGMPSVPGIYINGGKKVIVK